MGVRVIHQASGFLRRLSRVDAVAHVGAGLPCDRFQLRQYGHEPDCEIVRSVEYDLEVLRGVDALEQVERGCQEAVSDGPALSGAVVLD